MPYYLDNQTLMALSENELLALHQTLTAELTALPARCGSSSHSAEMLARIVLVIHQKRQSRFDLALQPRL